MQKYLNQVNNHKRVTQGFHPDLQFVQGMALTYPLSHSRVVVGLN